MAGRMRTGLKLAGIVSGVVSAVAVTAGPLGPAATASADASSLLNVPTTLRHTLLTRSQVCPEVPVSVTAAQLEVASDFSTDATTAYGGRGIAAFTPTTWRVWGSDADGDGVASAFDVADAIDAQARRMCWLYGLARDSHLRGDRLKLALAAYESGWPTVLRAGGVPARSRWYVDEVSEAAWKYGKVVGTPFGDGWGVAVGFPLPVPNPRKASEAMAWARAREGDWGWEQRCLNFTAQAYGWSNSGTPYAIDHYWVVPARMRHHGDRNAPPGSLVFWDTGLRAGHVAISLGDGMIATNDIDTPGRISVVPASLVERRWGARYLGWTAPYFPEGATW